MTNIILKKIEPLLIRRLRQRAKQNGRTIEAEIIAILVSILTPQPPDTNDFRPPATSSLLSNTDTWEGSDFEDCLKTVMENHSYIALTSINT